MMNFLDQFKQSMFGGRGNTQNIGIPFEEYQSAMRDKEDRIEKLIHEKEELIKKTTELETRAKLQKNLESLQMDKQRLAERLANPEKAYQDHSARFNLIGATLCDVATINLVGENRLNAALSSFVDMKYEEIDALIDEVEQAGILIQSKAAFAKGNVAEDAIRWHDAYAHYKRAYDLTGDIDALEGYARMAWHLGKYQESLELSEMQLSHAKETHGEESEQVAEVLNNLAVLHENLGQSVRAEPLYYQAIEIGRKTIGEDHPEFANRLNNLAGLYEAMGRYEDAEPLYRQSIEIDRKTIGEDHPDFATRLNNLGVLYYRQERFSEAADLLRQALAIQEAKLPEEHTDTEGTRGSLENLYTLHPELRD